MKGYLYILQNEKGSFYVGSSKDLSRRLQEHLDGKTKSTRHAQKWKLVFSQEYEDLKIARQVEYKLKQFKSRKIIGAIVKDQKILINI